MNESDTKGRDKKTVYKNNIQRERERKDTMHLTVIGKVFKAFII